MPAMCLKDCFLFIFWDAAPNLCRVRPETRAFFFGTSCCPRRDQCPPVLSVNSKHKVLVPDSKQQTQSTVCSAPRGCISEQHETLGLQNPRANIKHV